MVILPTITEFGTLRVFPETVADFSVIFACYKDHF